MKKQGKARLERKFGGVCRERRENGRQLCHNVHAELQKEEREFRMFSSMLRMPTPLEFKSKLLFYSFRLFEVFLLNAISC